MSGCWSGLPTELEPVPESMFYRDIILQQPVHGLCKCYREALDMPIKAVRAKGRGQGCAVAVQL
jgi:hypothetical protein